MSISFEKGALIGSITLAITSLSASALALPVLASLPLAVTLPLEVNSVSHVPAQPVSQLAAQNSPPNVAAKSVSPVSRKPLLGKTVLIDPGHGGDDPGAMVDAVREKDVVLKVSLLFKAKLQALGATVAMTRDSDKTVALPLRRDESNSSCPDVFVSIHGNSNPNVLISGVETYYNDSSDKKLAQQLLTTVAAELQENSNWSLARNLLVLHGNRVPAALVEIGYLTNLHTRALLITTAYQDKVATALSDALVTYFADPKAESGCSSVAEASLAVGNFRIAHLRPAQHQVHARHSIQKRHRRLRTLRT